MLTEKMKRIVSVSGMAVLLLWTANCLAEEAWKTQANESIEQLRKRDVHITVTDQNGAPLQDVSVRIQQRKNHFPFGTANDNYRPDQWWPYSDNDHYANFVKENYNFACVSHPLVWVQNESVQGSPKWSSADYVVNSCRKNDIPMLMQNVFWENSNTIPNWAKALSNSELLNAMQSRIDYLTEHYGDDSFAAWCVLNEPYHTYLKNRLDSPTFNTRKWMFETMRSALPNAPLMLNSASVIGYQETDRFLEYKQTIQTFLNAGIPLDIIGIQCHMYGVDPYEMKQRLDSLAEFNLPIWITEYDDPTGETDEEKADNLEAFFRIAYAHPAVEVINMWGFWEGAIWRPGSELVDKNWNLTARGVRFFELMDEWATQYCGATDFSGTVDLRAFHGLYDVDIMLADGSIVNKTIAVEPGEGTASYTLEAVSVVWADSFDYASGETLEDHGWEIEIPDPGTGSVSLSTLMYASAPQSVRMSCTTTQPIKLYSPKYEEITSGTLSFKALQTRKASLLEAIMCVLTDPDGRLIAYIKFSSNGYIQLNHAGNTIVDLLEYSANQWYDIKVEFDLLRKDLRVIIDGHDYGIFHGLRDDFATKTNGFYLLLNTDTAGSAARGHYDDFKVEYIRFPQICGQIGTEFSSYDFNKDCIVNLEDFVELASWWGDCTDPQNSACE